MPSLSRSHQLGLRPIRERRVPVRGRFERRGVDRHQIELLVGVREPPHLPGPRRDRGGEPQVGGTCVSGPICSWTSLPTKTFAFASTVVRREPTIACDATNTASASDAAIRNTIASREDEARRRTARYHAETCVRSPRRRRISASNISPATIATPSASSIGNRNTADAGRSTVLPVTPPPA